MDKKYRPIVFGDVLGQTGTIRVLGRTLQNIEEDVAPSIFYGPFGSGKTTLARIYARAILCESRQEDGSPCNKCPSCQMFLADTHPGYVEIDGANITKVDDFRKILDSTDYQVAGSKYRVYLIDECHMMSKASQNLFLKPLEEGIEGVFWFFCTTEYHKIIETIRSRCLDYGIRPISHEAIAKRMMEICEAEGVPCEEEAALAVVSAKKAHIRDVLKFISQVRNVGGVTQEVVFEYLDVGINDAYFRALGSLTTNLDASLAAMSEALTRVSPQDAYNGLIVAAMDAYKESEGVQTQLLLRDASLRKHVHETYGSQLVTIGQYLIEKGARRIDTSYLISTLLMLRSYLSNPTGTTERVVVREIVKEVATPVSSPSPTPDNGAPPTQPKSAPTVRETTDTLTKLDYKATRPGTKPTVKKVQPKSRDGDEHSILSDQEFGLLLQRGPVDGR